MCKLNLGGSIHRDLTKGNYVTTVRYTYNTITLMDAYVSNTCLGDEATYCRSLCYQLQEFNPVLISHGIDWQLRESNAVAISLSTSGVNEFAA